VSKPKRKSSALVWVPVLPDGSLDIKAWGGGCFTVYRSKREAEGIPVARALLILASASQAGAGQEEAVSEPKTLLERFDALDDDSKHYVAELCSIVEDACRPLKGIIEQQQNRERALCSLLGCEPDALVARVRQQREALAKAEREVSACDGHGYLRDEIARLAKALESAPAPGPQTVRWGLEYADWWADVRLPALGEPKSSGRE